MSSLPEYGVWQGMRSRCNNPKNKRYSQYGGRGIRVWPEWDASFPAFYSSIGPRPGPGYSLDRIDNSKGYEPGNVRWATNKVQSRNKSTNHVIEFAGLSLTLAEWADRLSISSSLLRARLGRLGWSVEKALTAPVTE